MWNQQVFTPTRLEKRHACTAAELLNRRRKRYELVDEFV